MRSITVSKYYIFYKYVHCLLYCVHVEKIPVILNPAIFADLVKSNARSSANWLHKTGKSYESKHK